MNNRWFSRVIQGVGLMMSLTLLLTVSIMPVRLHAYPGCPVGALCWFDGAAGNGNCDFYSGSCACDWLGTFGGGCSSGE